jgi:glutamate-1-semialdehyde 2,1-aminomutase
MIETPLASADTTVAGAKTANCGEYRTGLRVSGLGSLLNIHAGGVPSSNAPANALLFFDLLERGFYCAPRGLIALSLAIDDTHISAFLAAIRDLLEVRAGLL